MTVSRRADSSRSHASVAKAREHSLLRFLLHRPGQDGQEVHTPEHDDDDNYDYHCR